MFGKRTLAALSLFCGAASLAGCDYWHEGNGGEGVPPRTGASYQAKRLFDLCRMAEGRDIEVRMTAAEKLATAPEAEGWIVLALVDELALQVIDAPMPAELELPELWGYTRRAVIARILENLPPNASGAVLFAVTQFLSETRGGEYPTFEGLTIGRLKVLGKTGEGKTRPLRDSAREMLVRALGVDHVYDEVAWRQEILTRRRSSMHAGQSGTRGGADKSSQP